MLYFALPVLEDNHLSVDKCDKYTSFIAKTNIKIDSPLYISEVSIHNDRNIVQTIHNKLYDILNKNYMHFAQETQLEISHHYGLENYINKPYYGMGIITLINKEYCKKILIIQKDNINPEHYHKEKKETFFILSGKVKIDVDNKENILQKDDILTIEPSQKHTIYALEDSIIEEISTQHKPNDSFYTDEKINNNCNRKTLVYL
jgi:mannose-6-phosphate isomerase-like protein (cupin superfamily)